jgi:hypothetical protein
MRDPNRPKMKSCEGGVQLMARRPVATVRLLAAAVALTTLAALASWHREQKRISCCVRDFAATPGLDGVRDYGRSGGTKRYHPQVSKYL